jgi:hypothetical protein
VLVDTSLFPQLSYVVILTFTRDPGKKQEKNILAATFCVDALYNSGSIVAGGIYEGWNS